MTPYEKQLQMIEELDRELRRGLAARRRDHKIGWWMVAFLAAGTVVEYVIAVKMDWNFPLMVMINLVEALAIIVYFMHLPKAFGRGHGAEER